MWGMKGTEGSVTCGAATLRHRIVASSPGYEPCEFMILARKVEEDRAIGELVEASLVRWH